MVVPHIMVPASDGVKLAVKLWMPSTTLDGTTFEDAEHHVMYIPDDPTATDAPSPVIMEYIPYRKSDGTLARDHRRLPWIASHGYVCARVDMRGSGDSEGTYFGEYLPQEQKDACDLIAWFAAQVWCNGRVGMYGKSWSGFNGLQVAYEQPPALKAVISLYSTDDRYASDVHYMGGCIVGNQALWWSSYVHTLNASPPNPGHVTNWRALWRQRLEEASEPMAHDWFTHQTRDEFWKHGSVCEDPQRLKDCPILLIGGWNDGYRDAVLRGVHTFPNVRGIVGPWCHNWPDVGTPGPAIAFTEECLKWWDCHLKGVDNGAMESPLLRAYIQDSFRPHPDVDVDRQGEWVTDDTWPPTESNRWIHLVPDNGTGMLHWTDDVTGLSESSADVKFTGTHGSSCGEWWFISTNSAPGDQQMEDAQALCWTSKELESDVSILGFPEMELSLAASSDTGNVIVRICDVFQDGTSNLVTWGPLNLTHRDGHDTMEVKPLVPGQRYKVKVKCLSIGYTIPKGHKVRVAVAPNYFPLIWPSKDAVKLNVTTGIDTSPSDKAKVFFSQLDLPIKRAIPVSTLDKPQFSPACPDYAILPVHQIRPASYRRYIEKDVSSRSHVFIVKEDSGKSFIHQTRTIMGSQFEGRYAMVGDDPQSARVNIECCKEYEYPDEQAGIRTEIRTSSSMTCTTKDFNFVHKLEVKINDEVFFSRKWVKVIPRNNV